MVKDVLFGCVLLRFYYDLYMIMRVEPLAARINRREMDGTRASTPDAPIEALPSANVAMTRSMHCDR
jgi:hypothetical protein